MSEAIQIRQTNIRELLQRYGLILSFLLLCLVLSILSDRFLTVDNMVNVLRQSTINGIIAVGMTFVILTAGIDLSVGSILALSSVVTAAMLQSGVPVPAAISGWTWNRRSAGPRLTGSLLPRASVPPFVATLGMMTVARGLALDIHGRKTHHRTYRMHSVSSERVLSVRYRCPLLSPLRPSSSAIFFLTERSWANSFMPSATIRSQPGTQVSRVSLYVSLVYVLSGLLAALAGMILIARLGSAQPTAGLAFEFNAIAAVVVGGTSLAGGKGGLGGTLIGVLIIAVLSQRP